YDDVYLTRGGEGGAVIHQAMAAGVAGGNVEERGKYVMAEGQKRVQYKPVVAHLPPSNPHPMNLPLRGPPREDPLGWTPCPIWGINW
ncbi:hypothetical protein Tco_0376167, partial [Tanacetum coccineum]